MSKLIKYLTAATVLALPFNLNLLVYESEWGRGLFNPYTSVSISVFDLLVLAIFGLLLIKIRLDGEKLKTGKQSFLLVFLLVISTQVLSLIVTPFGDPVLSALLTFKLLVLLLFYLILVNKTLRIRDMVELFILLMCAESLLGLTQFMIQGSLGLGFLGESTLSADTANLARMNIGDINLIRAYGTFPHPNVFSGFLVVSLLMTLIFHPHLKYERGSVYLIQLVGLLLTFSRTGLAAFTFGIICLAIWYFKDLKKVLKSKNIGVKFQVLSVLGIFLASPLLLIWITRSITLFNDGAWAERIMGLEFAIELFVKHPFGVGFNHFTLFLDEVTVNTLMAWEYQPVHNIFLLVLSESGFLGLASVVIAAGFLFYRFRRKRKKLLSRHQQFKKRVFLIITIAILFMMNFDHYWSTLDQGRALLVFLFGIFSVFSQNPRHILPIKKEEKLSKILTGQG